MLAFFTRYATAMTTALFAVTAITGVMMFFHLGKAYVEGMHEWLSLLLLLPIVFHVYRNWRPFFLYFKNRVIVGPAILAAIGVVAFLVPALLAPSGGDPARRLLTAMGDVRVADLAPLVKKTPDQLTAALTEKGLNATSPQLTLNEVAKASGKSPRDAVRLVGETLPAGKR